MVHSLGALLEEGSEQLETSPMSARKTEVLHLGNDVDVLIPAYMQGKGETAKLIKMFENGLPEEVLPDPEASRVLYVPSSSPEYVVKVRPFFADALEGLSPVSDSLPLGYTTILPEIELAPRIERTVMSSQMQALVRHYGFAGFHYPKPLIGVTDRNYNAQLKVRRFAPGMRLDMYWYRHAKTFRCLVDSLFSGRDYSTPGPLLLDLYTRFTQAGIEPVDLYARQLIVDPRRHLHLIDAECFIPRP